MNSPRSGQRSEIRNSSEPGGNSLRVGSKVFACLGILVVCSMSPLSAQSVNSFGSKTPAPAAKKEKAPEAKTSAGPAPSGSPAPSAAVSTPSRYIGVADLEPYVAAVSEVLSIQKRNTDPFGQLQDPDAKPIIKTSVAKATKRIAPVQSFPFSDIINRIKINTVMPKEKKFLVGTRSFVEGGHMNLAFRTKSISVSIVSVTANQIDLKNLETGETASIKINLLPVGMTPGNHGITAPGMVKDQPNAPIDIESPDATADSALQSP